MNARMNAEERTEELLSLRQRIKEAEEKIEFLELQQIKNKDELIEIIQDQVHRLLMLIRG